VRKKGQTFNKVFYTVHPLLVTSIFIVGKVDDYSRDRSGVQEMNFQL